MSTVLVQFRVKPELKAQAEAIFSEMGLEMTDALRVFLQQSVNVGGLPFHPSPKRPNAVTLAAMQEVGTDATTRYDSAQDFFDAHDI